MFFYFLFYFLCLSKTTFLFELMSKKGNVAFSSDIVVTQPFYGLHFSGPVKRLKKKCNRHDKSKFIQFLDIRNEYFLVRVAAG